MERSVGYDLIYFPFVFKLILHIFRLFRSYECKTIILQSFDK